MKFKMGLEDLYEPTKEDLAFEEWYSTRCEELGVDLPDTLRSTYRSSSRLNKITKQCLKMNKRL